MEQQIENHPFGTFADENSEVLIIGTFPTHKRRRSFDFFYPNKNNAFWEIMQIVYDYKFVYNSDLLAVNERRKFAKERRIAFTDMLEKAIRKNDNAGDSQLEPIELMNIISILSKCPKIKRIVLTSRSGNVNALSLFNHHFLEHKIHVYYNTKEKLSRGFLEYAGNKIDVFVPYSPSPRVVRRFGLEFLVGMYAAALTE